MKTKIFLFIILFQLSFSLNIIYAQNNKDTMKVKNLNEVIISSPRNDMPLKEVPAAISIVTNEQLNTMSKSIAADEAFRLVPGVKVDNGTDGSRVHLYIRGQGVLAEAGFRGIAVFIDGISINDPGGYCPDLYDVDWNTVKNVEIVKGLATSMYGGSGTGGVVNITTEDGGEKPLNETFYASAGSYGFMKVMDQVDGTQGDVNYRISYSHSQGNGYRQHQAFMGDNFSEKLNWKSSKKFKLTQMLSYTNYFNQNSEGMNMARIKGEIIGWQSNNVGWRASNNDAVPYNEFHLTQRLTGSLIGKYNITENQDVTVKGFYRMNNYRETSNNGDDYKPYINPGVSAQYNLTNGKEKLINHFSLGADFSAQTIKEHWFAVPGEMERDSLRADNHFGQECYDLDVIKINQIIKQRSVGLFAIDKVDISKKLFATVNIRYDYVYNKLENNMPVPDSLSNSGNRNFQKPTYRIGLAYDLCKFINIYGSYGTGFLVPTNNELYNNPDFFGGFNTSIEPTTSQGEEIGIRGNLGKKIYYDITAFNITSKNGVFRYSLPDRGNNTAFFGNIDEHKSGVETYLSYSPVKYIRLDLTYTYSNFVYPAHDGIATHLIPNCPKHMLTAEVGLKLNKNFTLTLNTEYQSKWKLQVYDSIYNTYEISQTYYQPYSVQSSWVTAYDKNNNPLKYGYNIYNAELNYKWKLGTFEGDISLYAKNILDQHYFGFTEPNNGGDYNCYQPAPGREFFVSLKIKI